MATSGALRELDSKELEKELSRTGRSKAFPARESKSLNLPENKPDAWYGGAEARRIADSLLSWQTPSGGWSKNTDMLSRPRETGQRWSPGDDWSYVATIDNKATTSQIEFLARTASALGPEGEPYRRGVERGLRYLLAAQNPAGGWPQVFPLQGKYHDHITFNDDAMIRVLTVLRQVGKDREPYQFVKEGLRQEADAAARRGIVCILSCQIVVDGQRTAWCAQHNALTLAPVKARAYELASISGGEETVGILRFLMTLGKPSAEVRNAIESGVAWLRRSQLQSGEAGVKASRTKEEWARFYEIETNRPLFSDPDGKKRYSFSQVKKKRNSYSWFSDAPAHLLSRDYPKWKRRLEAGK